MKTLRKVYDLQGIAMFKIIFYSRIQIAFLTLGVFLIKLITTELFHKQ